MLVFKVTLRQHPQNIFAKKSQPMDLMTSLKQGDQTAMDTIYKTHWEQVFDAAYKRVGTEDIAQDITQDIFISLWEKRETLEIRETLSAYLLTSVKYRVINYFKANLTKEKYTEDLYALIGNTSPLHPTNELAVKEIHKELDQAIAELPERMRQIFSMSRKQEKSNNEISAELNLSIQTVKNQLTAALKIIRKRLAYLTLFFF
ncbi:RNA polymerase sigma-70 factor [Pedobacter sp. UYP1]|uniref:RNA polymerase sigma-70 factor n=1 Tax=Pedobacter sp. UYP1 TaxID=1756396 RepID=UPI00339B35A0